MMTMSAKALLSWCLTLAAVVVLGVSFLYLPNGWNLIPLILIAGLGAARVAWGRSAANRRTEVAVGSPPDRPEQDDGQDSQALPVPAPARGRSWSGRANRAFGPVVAGLIMDVVDLATWGPVGLVLGLPIGGLTGYWMGRALGLARKPALWCALAGGIYCAIPGTGIITLAQGVGEIGRAHV